MCSLKFTLDRTSLEVFYFSFIRPILEYADVVWDNRTQSEEDDLEKIQLEAARIICGATKLVFINNLYSETGLEPLSIRRRTHRRIVFYKMYHALAPRYLSSLILSQVGNITSYNLRNIRAVNLSSWPHNTTYLFSENCTLCVLSWHAKYNSYIAVKLMFQLCTPRNGIVSQSEFNQSRNNKHK